MRFRLPTLPLPILDRPSLGLCLLWAALFGAGVHVSAQSVVLHLQNGDRIAGVLLSQTTNSLVLSNAWASELKIPRAAVVSREPPEIAPPAPAPTSPPATPAIAVVPPPAAPKPATRGPKQWKADVNLGTTFIYGTTEQQNYYGTATLTYEHPYRANPKKFFRHLANYTINYGEVNQVVSANQMWGSMKTDVDLTERVFAYNLGMAGYDLVRKVDLQWEVGPGLGYHLFRSSRFAVNAEVGSQYLVQNLTTGVDSQNIYLRFAENATWQIADRVTLKENLAYLPQSLDFGTYRLRLEGTLSFAVLNNVSLNFTVMNFFNSLPAAGVEPNQLQIRSTLGVHF